MQKKGFKEIALKRAVIALIVIAVLFGCTCLVGICIKKMSIDEAFEIRFASIEVSTGRRLNDDTVENQKAVLIYILCSEAASSSNCNYGNSYYALVDDETGEAVVDSEAKACTYYSIPGDNGVDRAYFLYNDDFGQYLDLYSECYTVDYESMDEFDRVVDFYQGGFYHFDEVYVKDRTFLPATVTYHEKENFFGTSLLHWEYYNPLDKGASGVAWIDEDERKTITFEYDNLEGYELKEATGLTFYGGTLSGTDFISHARSCMKGEGEVLRDAAGFNAYDNARSVTIKDVSGHSYTLFGYTSSGDIFETTVVILLGFLLFYVVAGTAVVLISSAVTARKERLSAAIEDYRVNLINAMAHDLKTPLMATGGYAENILNDIHTEKCAHYAEEISDNASYMNGIVSDVMDLSELEDLDKGLRKTDVEFISMINSSLDKYKELLSERQITVETTGDFSIKADAKLMLRASDNIASNLIKYTRPGSKISISGSVGKGFAGKKGKHKILCIINETDEKISVDPQKLTEPFVKGDTSRSDRKGSGLGLAITNNILEMHGFRQQISFKDKIYEQKIED